MSIQTILPILLFFLPLLINAFSQQHHQDTIANDPSLASGSIALPLALQAAKIKEQRSIPTEPSVRQTSPIDQMPATPAQNRVETIFPATAMEKSQTPMVVIWSRKFKSEDF